MAKSVQINASADDVWQIIGPGFSEVGKWSTAVDHSDAYGDAQYEGAACDGRGCDLSARGFTSVKEKITEYDAPNRTMAFDVIEGMPKFVLYTNNRTVITTSSDGKSTAQLQITMHMKPFMGSLLGGMFKKNLSNLIDSALDDLKVYAETGVPSARKQARMKKLAAQAA